MNTEVKNTETLTKTAQQQVVLKPGFHAKQGSTVTLSIEPSGASFTPSEDYKVDQLTYDANGNIQSLRRNQSSSNGNRAMDDLTYHYNTEKPNQLQQVTDAVTASTNAGDISSQYSTENYKYNSIGQLVRNNAEGINYTYNASGLVTEVNTRYVSVQFYYNDRNQRVRKVVSRNGQRPVTTVYVRDAAGTPMAIYRNGTLVEHTVYGASRLGVYKRQGNATHKTSYELTDHLGNVRAVVSRANTSTITGTDYYPFGMPMPLRNSLSDYRYAYQGQEKDPETGKEAFELRLWDARIGRWLTTDPKHEFASPYLGMGNNPINLIDPDGGKTENKFKLNKDGSTELTETNDDNFDELFSDDGTFIGKVNKGFLHDGLNIKHDGLFLDVKNKEDFHSYLNFISDLSIFEDKEIGGFFFNDNNDFDNIYITPYNGNKFNSAPSIVTFKNNGNHNIAKQIYFVGNSYHKATAWFHTHPGIAHGNGYGSANASQGDKNFTKRVGVPGLILGGWQDLGIINTDGTNKIWPFGGQ